MCGIAGLLIAPDGPGAHRTAGRDPKALRRGAERMAATLAHRGPDDAGAWADASAGVAFGFRRLAILDLSPRGHQPMTSASGRFTLVYNGEVYNHRALREELAEAGARFVGHSDTETVLAAFEAWGVEAALRRFVGMFALAVWDAQERELRLARDRLGIKPLFVHARPGLVAFASELKALVAAPGFERAVDPEALASYLRFLYVPAPQCILRGVTKLLPGHLMTVRPGGAEVPAPRPWWSLPDAARAGVREPLVCSAEEAADALEATLSEAVAERTLADVPVGALLSGGIDSSLVAALMQRRAERPVRTYTIGFDQPEFDEARHAAAVARHLGTAHTELRVSGKDALELVPRLPELFDEPLADPSQIPTHLVSALARREVGVALSGDGGDELFAGYNRYTVGARLVRRAAPLPRGLRAGGAALLDACLEAGAALGAHGLAGRAAGPGGAPSSAARRERLRKVAAVLRADTAPAMVEALLGVWPAAARLVPDAPEAHLAAVRDAFARPQPGGVLERMLLADQHCYLPDDLLAKVDRASMAVGLEVRVPLLDHRVVELSWRLPPSLKVREGRGKWLLRRVLARHVPPALVERPKMGFSVPIAAWLRGPLRPLAEDLLQREALARTGALRPEPIGRAWRALLAGDGSPALGLWAVLVFLLWWRRWMR